MQKSWLFLFFFLLMSFRIWAQGPMAQVSFFEDSFLSPDFESSQKKDFSYLGAKFAHNTNSSDDSNIVAEIDGRYAPTQAMMGYLNVSQLAWRDEHLSVGRKKIAWSRLDENWHFGLYQPLFKWNPLDPATQGLTGLFLELNDAFWGLKIFASFLHIPDQGPSYEIKNGNFERVNPWFQTPPRHVRFLGQTDAVNYDIQKPQTNEIIFNRSFVAQLHLGADTSGLYFQTAFAHKPANQLAMGFDGYLTPDDKAQVRIVPKIFYHSLVSSELSYTRSNLTVGMTSLFEKPETPDFSQELSYVVYRPSSLMSPFVEYKTRVFRGQMSYLKVQGGEADLQGGFVPAGSTSSGSAILPMRYPFSEAVSVDLSSEQNLKKQRSLTESLNYTEGAGHLFSLWTLKTEAQLSKLYRVNLALQVLRAADTEEAQKSLAGQYQNNDSISLGGSYVF